MGATVLYPGTFDPIHNGHVEIIETASRLFDHVVVSVMHNPQKATSMFTFEDRQAMIEESTSHLDNVRVIASAALAVDAARDAGADMIVKGLRAVNDFESELQQAQTNHEISGIHTLFIPSASTNSFIASRYIREIARFGRDVSSMVPDGVAKRLLEATQ